MKKQKSPSKSSDKHSSSKSTVTNTLFNSLKSYRKLFLILCVFAVSTFLVFVSRAAISLSTSTPYTQNFDSIGSTATATLPTDFKLDRLTGARVVGTYSAATTATTATGGTNLSSSAGNGAYNFGATASSTDRAIGFLSSGSATQSGNLYAQLVNNTGGTLSGLRISYDVEKYRNGTNAAGFRIQMYYSTDGTTWTSAGNDFKTLFAANADSNGFASAPGATVSITNQTLNIPINSGSNFYLAWNYSVESGSTTSNAQALAVDNINILGLAGAVSTNPTGTGSASPSQVFANGSSLLTVAVTPGSNPASTGLTVTGNLSAIGGSSSQTFFDNGTNGDVTSGDNIFSYNATVANNTTAGTKNLPITVADAESRSSNTSISLEVLSTPAPSGSVVISQLYGGGGNSGALYKNDYVELFNRSNATVDLTGWSVQYASSAGNFGGGTSRTVLSGSILPGRYYLIQLAAGTGGTQDLPTPDVIGTTNMSGTSGKVALANNSTFLSGSCATGSSVVDFVGYGAANCSEGGAAAPELSNETAAKRAREGCRDTDVNAANFAVVTPSPRNSSTAPNVCPTGDDAPEVFTTSPVANGTNVLPDADISITFDEAVFVTGNWYQMSCSMSGPITATVSGGPATYILNPANNLAGDETCTVTVFAANVNDVDTDDPPDFMVNNYVFTFRVTPNRTPAEHLVMGNPTNAITDENIPDNYLLQKNQYVMSYNRDKGTANWVSWHLDSTWLGSAPRQDDFRNDPSLPAGWYQVLATDYQNSGFDRGHMTPSADRTSTIPDNSATFFMTNMIPQAPDNNQGPWANLENYGRTLVAEGNEVYILSGGAGVGGTGSNGGGVTITIANGHVTVPAYTWKVLLVLPAADGDDVARVNASTRIIAVIMPNVQGIRTDDWKKYLATVDQIETLVNGQSFVGNFDLFSNVPVAIQNAIESKVDTVNNTAPVASNNSMNTTQNLSVQVTLSATDANINNQLSFSVVNAPIHGSLGSISAPTCNNGTCTATVTYTPNTGYTGTDSFTFRANDSVADSNTATVNLSIGAPTGAETTVSGRIANVFGTGIPKAEVRLINMTTGAVMTARTNPFGYYMFDGVEVGDSYTITVSHKSYTFASEFVTIVGDTNINFTGNLFER